MKFNHLIRGLLLILIATVCPSCLDNECENAYSVDRTIKFSKTNPGDILLFKDVNYRKVTCTVELENVCLLSLIDVDVNMLANKAENIMQESPTILIYIDGKMPSAIYNRSEKKYKNTVLQTYSCSSVASADKATVTIELMVFDQMASLDLKMIESLRVVINYFELPGGANP